ncbi:MAG: hypothetical protein PHO79_07545 [Desulfoplanes sp.]|nr:hypothetical protein [Desulfoplanes sp.]
MNIRVRSLCISLISCFLSIGFGFANSVYALDSTLSIDIYGPGQTQVHLYLPTPLPGKGEPFVAPLPDRVSGLASRLHDNLAFLPFFSFVAPADLLGGPGLGGYRSQDIDFKKLQLSKVDLVLTTAWNGDRSNPDSVELRAIEAFTGRLVLGKAYLIHDDKQIADVATRFCAALMKILTGSGDFFETRIAFVCRQKKNKEICLISPQGHELFQVTHDDGISLSPSWSPDGRKLAFTYLDSKGHRLAVWDRDSKKINKYDLPGHTCIGPAFDADGSLAISVDPFGNPDIYKLNASFGIKDLHAPLVRDGGIDISATFDRKGSKMAFVSSRFGNPHIFVMETGTGVVSRVTYEGTYNTCPCLSPDGTLLAFARRTSEGHRIFITTLATGVEQQVTFGPGNDEDPTWSPDGYFLAFTSSRSGGYQLYVTTKHGDSAKHIPTGTADATAPAWGPVPWP